MCSTTFPYTGRENTGTGKVELRSSIEGWADRNANARDPAKINTAEMHRGRRILSTCIAGAPCSQNALRGA